MALAEVALAEAEITHLQYNTVSVKYKLLEIVLSFHPF